MSPVPTARLRPFQPTPFGRYTLLAPLAMGGMGEIFLARLEGHHGFEKLCVIKKILPGFAAEPDFVARFVNEAKILVKLSHGSIAQVLEMNLQDGAPYIALEFVDGKDLRKVAQRLKERGQPFPIPLALYVMTRVLDALGYAHRKKDENDQELRLVHRDVSPQNILLSYEGEVKVVDFGLAKSSLSEAKTHPSMVLGKFLYMSPEQARHQRVDRRSDLYAAGLCLYELVAGANPLEGPAGDLLAQVTHPNFPRLADVAPRCPRGLSETVMKALAVDPAQRFQTAEEMRARLLGALLELDPSAGAESAAELMREQFAAEYQQERKLVAAARDTSTPSERIAAGKRSTMTALPALAPPSKGPPPLPTASKPPPAAPPPLPSLSGEHEPTQPGARASEIEALHRRAEAGKASRTGPAPEPLAALEPTRPGVPSPLLEEVRSPFTEPTVPGVASPLLAQPKVPPGQASTREVPVPPPALAGSGAPTRELRLPIPEGARPTPGERPATQAPGTAAPDGAGSIVLTEDLLAAGAGTSAPPRAPPVLPSPLLSASAPTVPAMPQAVAPPPPEDPPVVMGVLLDEPEPPVSARPARREAEPPRPVPTLTPASSPAVPPPEPARSNTEPSLRRVAIPVRSTRKPRKLGWVGAGAIVLVVGVVGFFVHDFYVAGLFDGALAHLPAGVRAHLHPLDAAVEAPAVPGAVPLDAQVLGPRGPPSLRLEAPPKPAPAAPATPPSSEASEEEDGDLALLQALPAAHAPGKRKPPRRATPLQKEWAKARAEFHHLEQDSPCEADGMAMLCARYRALEASVGSAEDPNDPKLLERVKEVRRLIAKKAGP